MSQQRHHRREDPERDVPGDVRPAQTDDGGDDEAEETEADRREQRWSQDAVNYVAGPRG
jgi:hypothetical protein